MLGTVGSLYTCSLSDLLKPSQIRRSLSISTAQTQLIYFCMLMIWCSQCHHLVFFDGLFWPSSRNLKDLGELYHFLGMRVQRCDQGLLLSQRQFMLDILERAKMTE